MGLPAAAHLMDKAHLSSNSTASTTTNTSMVTSTFPVATATAHPVSNSTVWITTTISSALTQFATASASDSNTTMAPSTSWVTTTANATTTFVDWTVSPAVTLTTSPTSPPVSSPASTSGITIVLKGVTIGTVVTTTSYVAPTPTSFPDNVSNKVYNYWANCHDQQKCKYSEYCTGDDDWPAGFGGAHFDWCFTWCKEGHNAACDTLEKDNLSGIDYPADWQGYPTTSYSGEVAKWPPPTAYPRA